MRTANWRKAKELSHEALVQIVAEMWDRADDKRYRKEAKEQDLKDAAEEMLGTAQARLFEMPTVLDARVETYDDSGEVDWKDRDEASFKEHRAFNDRMESLHLRAAGIRKRKGERLDDWADEQGAQFDHAAPIGPYLWRDTRCAICGEGYRDEDPFEWAHDIAVALGGGDGTMQLAHRSCNRAEGVG